MKKPKSSTLQSLLSLLNKARIIEKHQLKDSAALDELHDQSRRKFLLNSSKALAGLSLMSLTTSCNTKLKKGAIGDSKLTPRIAIIGGGIAGLNCAYTLKKAGITAQIYEADRNRVGGRIFTQKNIFSEGITTEFGAEFIDTNHRDMLDLLDEFKLEKIDVQDDYLDGKIVKHAYYFEDHHYSEEDVISEFRGIVKQLEMDKEAIGENYDTPQCEKLDHTSLEEYIRSLPCNKWLQDMLIYAYIAEFGTEAGQQSSLNFIDMIETETADGFHIFGVSDERFKIKGGNQIIIEKLKEKLEAQINMAYQLVGIRNEGNGYLLSFDNGKEVMADMVVITIPFSILKDLDLKIAEMSPEKLACIQTLGYGQNNKLILGYNSRPWREGATSYAGYLYNTQIQNGWDSGHMQQKNQSSTGYTVFLGGNASLELAQSARQLKTRDTVDEKIAAYYANRLDAVFPGAQAKYAGMHRAALWSNNPFVKGSYANYLVGQWTSIAGLESETVGKVYFAGEHCSENFQGYMNGGAETGRKAAEAILASLT